MATMATSHVASLTRKTLMATAQMALLLHCCCGRFGMLVLVNCVSFSCVYMHLLALPPCAALLLCWPGASCVLLALSSSDPVHAHLLASFWCPHLYPFLVLHHRPDRLGILVDCVSFSFLLWLYLIPPTCASLLVSSVFFFTNFSVMCFTHAACCTSFWLTLLTVTVDFSCSPQGYHLPVSLSIWKRKIFYKSLNLSNSMINLIKYINL